MHFIIGTAGHVDHGKTTLIRALTGIETDRLREEKERGLSIVPGFAHLDLPDGRTVGIVDVPGHERFLKNMLAGVTGVDVALLVIAADEGVMPQTAEHLHILELLRIRRGVVALTKVDAVDADWLALARDDVRERLQDTFLAKAPLVEVCAPQEQGLDALKAALAEACDAIEATAFERAAPFRLAIDRAFSVSGFGTVVTGSASAGAVAVGESIEVWRPHSERPLAARVRGLEVHGAPVERAGRGQRVAINLAGVDLDEAARGGLVAAPGTLRAALSVEAWLQVLSDAPRPIKDGAPLRLHLGTGEVGARVSLHEGARLRPGESGLARLRLEHPLVGARGDRCILREVATERVLGGGLILELDATLPRAAWREALPALRSAVEAAQENGDDAPLAELLLRRAGAAGLTEAQLRCELHRLDAAPVWGALRERGALWSGEPTDSFLHAEVAASLREQIAAQLAAFHGREPLQAFMPRESLRAALPGTLAVPVFEALLQALGVAGKLEVAPAGARLSGHRVTLDDEAARLRDRLLALVHEAAWQPLTLDELAGQWPDAALARKLCFALLGGGMLVRVGDFVLTARRLEEGAARLRAHLELHGTLTVGEARELLNSTRKWIVPLLEYYDRAGLTKRVGEARILRV